MSKQERSGKRVGGSLYIHRDATPLLGSQYATLQVALAIAPDTKWNVAKIQKSSVSLLTYETFDSDFPALLHATTVNIQTGSVRETDYRNRKNPPILHRKELLLPPQDPRLPQFRALTAAAEEHGLFKDANKIGTRNAWLAKIVSAGLKLQNGRLVDANDDGLDIARHRTAIIRRNLSQPMQLMLRAGIVNESRSVFDYGCGQGEDVAALALQGFKAFGWDPHHAPDGPRQPAAIVNLGFVLNVVEDPHERLQTLKSAWHFAEQALCVAVMIRGRVSTAGHRPYRDGFITSRGTFQKYFDQQELRKFVADAVGEQPIALAPGIVAAFRDKDLEQEVLLRLRSRAFFGRALPRPPVRERVTVERPDLRERISPILQQVRGLAISLGRVPEVFEIPTAIGSELEANRVSWARAAQLLRDDLVSDDAYIKSRDARYDDLLVHFALMQFPGSRNYRSLPKSIQADVKALFGSHSRARDEGRKHLFDTGNREKIRSAITLSVEAKLGGYRGEHWYRFRSTALPRLPTTLRILVGCAEVLQGGVDACDFVDINIEAARIAMVTCDDVEQQIPFMIERTTVDLARLKVSVAKFDPQTMPIYFKSKYLSGDDPDLAEQIDADERLAATGLFEANASEPPWDVVQKALKGPNWSGLLQCKVSRPASS